MGYRRPVARFWRRVSRRLGRLDLGRLVGASLVAHLAALALALWVSITAPLLPPPVVEPPPVIVELPPAAPGTPLSRPETQGPRGGRTGAGRSVARANPPAARSTAPAPPATGVPARPTPRAEPEAPPAAALPPAPAPEAPAPPETPAVAARTPSPPTPDLPQAAPPEPAPPPVAARPPELARIAPRSSQRAPAMTPAPMAPGAAAPPPAAARPPEPAPLLAPRAPDGTLASGPGPVRSTEPTPPPPVAALPPDLSGVPSAPRGFPGSPGVPTNRAGPSAPAPAPPPGAGTAPPPPGPAPLPGRQYSILAPRLEGPPGGQGNVSGRGGTQQRGEGAGATGKLLDGQVPIPIDTPDPRYAEYFMMLKRRIEANWSYPEEAIRNRKSGQGVIGFVLQKDGKVQVVGVLTSTGVPILDRNIEIAIRFAQPFPPIPWNLGEDALPISVNFRYTLSGLTVFGFQ